MILCWISCYFYTNMSLHKEMHCQKELHAAKKNRTCIWERAPDPLRRGVVTGLFVGTSNSLSASKYASMSIELALLPARLRASSNTSAVSASLRGYERAIDEDLDMA